MGTLSVHIQGRFFEFSLISPTSYMYVTNERPESTVGCERSFNSYKFGMSRFLPKYFKDNYSAGGKSQVRQNLMERDINVVVGEQDDKAVNVRSCPASAQGSSRLERGRNYYNHMKSFDENSKTN